MKREFLKSVLIGAGFALLLWAMVMVSCYLSISPVGSDEFLSFAVPLWFLSLIIGPILTLALLLSLLWEKSKGGARKQAIAATAFTAVSVAALIFANPGSLGWKIRKHAFYRLAERSRPLIAAINAYCQKNGVPPGNLAELVPAYIPKAPRTGIGAYPEFTYQSLEGGMTGPDGKPLEYGNPWMLSVSTPFGMNFDQFLYLPNGAYPKEGYGGVLERIGDWAYVHE